MNILIDAMAALTIIVLAVGFPVVKIALEIRNIEHDPKATESQRKDRNGRVFAYNMLALCMLILILNYTTGTAFANKYLAFVGINLFALIYQIRRVQLINANKPGPIL